MWIHHTLGWMACFCLVVVSAGCSPPPGPSAETEALTPLLLAHSDVGAPFGEGNQNAVGIGGGKVCPEADYRTDDHGAVRVAFSTASGDHSIELTETLWAVGEESIGEVFAGLAVSFAVCDGARWDDYGEGYVFAEKVDPGLGDDSVAGSLRFGDGIRGDGEAVDEERTVIVRVGDIYAEFVLYEQLAGISSDPSIGDDEFLAIVARGVDRLTGAKGER